MGQLLTDKPSSGVAVSQVADSPDWSTRINVWWKI